MEQNFNTETGAPMPTASGVPVSMVHYAGFWWRVVAWIIDSVVLWVVQFVIGLVGSTGAVGLEGKGASIVLTVISIAISLIYFIGFEGSKYQATLGKMAVGAKVTDMAGNRISYMRATGRYFGKFISGIILGIGFLMVAFTEKKQGLHDIMAKTLVVKN